MSTELPAMVLTVIAECRPKLGASYFFVEDIENAGQASVIVEERRILVQTANKEIRVLLPSMISLVPGSISGLTSTISSLSFRTKIKDFSSATRPAHNRFSPGFHINDPVSLSCGLCHEPLTHSRIFSRVLPLPSSGESNDFFCHLHPHKPLTLDPKEADFFYDNFFYKINQDNFIVPPSDDKFKCPKCLERLGDVRGKSIRLWNSVVSLSSNGNHENNCIDTFLKALVYFIKDLPSLMNKFVFTSDGGTTTHYTLLWIMDKALVHLSNSNLTSSDDVSLEPKEVIKVLYSHQEELTTTTEEWMKSFNTTIVPIHPKVATTLVAHLKRVGGGVFAECASTDGMNVSYLHALENMT